MFVKFGESSKSWTDYTLVLPSISVGNVGQLTSDLLISTLAMVKVGGFHDDSLVPVIGNNPFHVGDSSKDCQIMTAAEVFENTENKLVVVQLRSAIVKGQTAQFVSRLQEWISSQSFKQVVILTSSFSHERTDSQLTGSQHRFVANADFKQQKDSNFNQDDLQWIPLEKRESHPAYRGLGEPQDSDKTKTEDHDFEDLFVPGGGFAKKLLVKCAENKIPTIALLRFCAEGDNLPDALELASYLNSWTKWVTPKESDRSEGLVQGWRIPPSWKLLFGSGFRQLLFQ